MTPLNERDLRLGGYGIAAALILICVVSLMLATK